MATTLDNIEGGVIAGRYEIVRELGRGGMGIVYLASHVQMERLCALKVLRSDSLISPDAVSRFHREARNASRISHPNVVSVYDFGETPEGMTYLAMEYVEGSSLDSLLEEVGALSPRRAARIAWQIANGLNVAHDLKIVHRDLKPANIMLTRYRSWEDFVKVVDFGIAKAFGTTSTTSRLTSAGLVVGTPGYMSPEQWVADEVDHRSDIYSLAMICVRMLAGDAAGHRPNVPIAGHLILEAIPSTADWPTELKAVLARGLAPLAEERYGSVAEFATEFVTAVTHWVPPTPGVRDPWEERLNPTMAVEVEVVQAPAVREVTPTIPARPVRRRGLAATGGVLVGFGIVSWIALAHPFKGTPGAQVGRRDSIRASRDTERTGPGVVLKHQTFPPKSGESKLPGRSVPPEVSAPAPPALRLGARTAPTPAQFTDSIIALRSMFDVRQPDTSSAKALVPRAIRLLRENLPDSVRIELTYHLAEAQFFLGDEASACAALQGVRPASEATGYFSRSIRQLLSVNCK